MIAIIVADKNEKVDLPFRKLKEITKNQFTYSIYENDIIIVHSGISIVNAAAATQSLIDNFDISLILNYGAVGGSTNTNLYDVIIPQKIFFYDVITPWYDRGQSPGEKPYFVNGMSNSKLSLASGSSFLDTPEKIKEIQQDINVDIFDMEAAAIAQISEKNSIPFICVKSVSDIVGTDLTEINTINKQIRIAGIRAFEKLLDIILKKINK